MSGRVAILTPDPASDGAPQLIELELIEPDLYLGHGEGAGARFAKAVVETI